METLYKGGKGGGESINTSVVNTFIPPPQKKKKQQPKNTHILTPILSYTTTTDLLTRNYPTKSMKESKHKWQCSTFTPLTTKIPVCREKTRWDGEVGNSCFNTNWHFRLRQQPKLTGTHARAHTYTHTCKRTGTGTCTHHTHMHINTQTHTHNAHTDRQTHHTHTETHTLCMKLYVNTHAQKYSHAYIYK